MIRQLPLSFRYSLIRRIPSPPLYRSFSGSIPTTKQMDDLMNKEKVPSVDNPTGSVSKTEGDAKKWAEGVTKNKSTNEGIVGESSQQSRSSQPAPSPGSSIDLFRQLRPPIPSLSSMLQPFHSLMPRSIRRQLRSIEDWMNDAVQHPFGGGGNQGDNQSGELMTDMRDLWYDFDRELARPVSLTLDEKENEYIAKLELKGFEKKDLSIRIQDDYLIISGSITKSEEKERKDQGKMNRSTSSSFTRVLALPDHIEKNNIKAKYEGSVLILTIPKDKQKMEYGRINIE